MPRSGKTFPTNSNTLNADSTIQIVPFGEDPLRQLAFLLLDREAARLPDLSRHVVLFPQTSAIPRFRQVLLNLASERGYPALLSPQTYTLASWAQRYADPESRRLSNTSRELLLFELLAALPALPKQAGGWPLIDSLLALFDELTLNQSAPSEHRDDFARAVANGYGMALDELAPFSNEVELVYTLWCAWRERLAQGGLQDQAQMTVDGLARSVVQMPDHTHVWLAGFVDYTHAELEWVKAMHTQTRLTLLLHGDMDENPDNPVAHTLRTLEHAPTPDNADGAYSSFLRRAYALNEGFLKDRAQVQRALAHTSPAGNHLIIYEATDVEQEARAIDIQVRRYYLQSCRNIGIVTNDRRLARRVRALLERAHINLQDAGGWALSTTSAATALSRWLECLETNFGHTPFLDFLKSPFLNLEASRDEFGLLVSRFEQAVVRECNILSGLDNYRAGAERVGPDLERYFGPEIHGSLTRVFDQIEAAARPLSDLIHNKNQRASDFLHALQGSLEKLGLSAEYGKDEAGSQLLDVLDGMRQALVHSDVRLGWKEFSHWLHRNIEQCRFRPLLTGGGVELMGFAESRLYRFDALIIAGALREHLPGKIGTPPFFNDGVRAQLGLPGLRKRYTVLFHDFRRLLEAAPRVMISLHRERRGEKLIPSPWVEQLRTFHALAYDETLADPVLDKLMQMPNLAIVHRDTALPIPPKQPAARLPVSMVPQSLTATSHQSLLNCPYQFYCAYGLALAPEEEIRAEMEKSDFGKHVHRILQAFHQGAEGLPGPWGKPLNAATLPEAETLLKQISAAVFAGDLRRNFLARGWLYRWEKNIPVYLAWEMGRMAQWHVQATEVRKERSIIDGTTQIILTGRIDRLDSSPEGYGIIDYKTGIVPDTTSVANGEETQLVFYSLLLDEKVAQVLYLSVQNDAVTEKMVLTGDTLAWLRENVKQRLVRLKRGLDNETALPAWGDNETCQRCSMEGICRKEMWANDASLA